jgi:hypothetical protein
MEDKKSLCGRLPELIFSRIHQDIGRASMCWEHPEQAGRFLCEVASNIAYDLCIFVAEELEKKGTYGSP